MVTIDRNDERTLEYVRKTLRGQPPEEIDWINRMSRPHLIQLIAQLKDALGRLGMTGDLTEVVELLDAWEATAAIDSDPELAEHLRLPRGKKEYVAWATGN